MPANGAVDAAGRVRMGLDQRAVERFAHAVQALELVTFDPPARSTMEATVSAYVGRNCGNRRGRRPSSRSAQAR